MLFQIYLRQMTQIDRKKLKGIWFYGLSGSGKTFATNICKDKIKNPFLIDGDIIRKLISFDLDYTLVDRQIQISRILGIIKLAFLNKKFPIASTVLMSEEIFLECLKIDVEVVEVVRPLEQIQKIRPLYKKMKNVVGNDIKQQHIATHKIYNNGKSSFGEVVAKLIK